MNQIFTSFNQRYRIYAAACIASLFKYTNADIEIIVLDTGINKSTRKKFEKWASTEKRNLRFINVTPGLYKSILGYKVKMPDSIEYYPRLLAPYFACAGTTKILYIDVDIICLQDPARIFDLNLDGNIIGAVKDPLIQTVGKGIVNFKDFNFDKSEDYFNSGVMLIDVNQWKINNISRDVLFTFIQHKKYSLFWDQYSLNIVLYRRWKKLDKSWNEILAVEKDVTFFRHFAAAKPLKENKLIADEDVFMFFLKSCPFYTFIWQMPRLMLTIAKLKWKLKYYSNKLLNTSYDIDLLEI